MEYIVIILIIIIVVIWLMSNSKSQENFDTRNPAANDLINAGQRNRPPPPPPPPKYGAGFCHNDYSPNKNNYHGKTDCGNGDGTYNDWKANGGKCPSGFTSDRNCGTGCAGGSGRCADP